MSDINVNDLTNSLQSTIKNIDASIKMNRYGIGTLNELTKQKSILSNHISDLNNKQEVNEEDEKNTTRLIAISSTKLFDAKPSSSKANNGLILGVVGVFSIVGLFYYFKNND